MVIPVGERYQQTLYLFRKRQGKLVAEPLRPTLFVPMTGRAEDARVVKPDPRNPKCRNGDFEADIPENGFVPGWYYQRQLTVVEEDAPQGQRYVRFDNEQPGLPAHLLQGIPVDGQHVVALQLTAQVKYENVRDSLTGEFASLAISFYDDTRKELGFRHLGRFQGESDWKEVTLKVPVPRDAASAILRIGLFGATGSLSVDNVRLTPVLADR